MQHLLKSSRIGLELGKWLFLVDAVVVAVWSMVVVAAVFALIFLECIFQLLLCQCKYHCIIATGMIHGLLVENYMGKMQIFAFHLSTSN